MSSAEAPPADAADADTAAATVPPLSLSTLQTYYPNLYQAYSHLSARQLECDEVVNSVTDEPTPIDAATGLATKIMFVDFTQPLLTTGDCPLQATSDGYKFSMFLFNMLNASESGSIGGDACRFYFALAAACDDIMAFHSKAAKFEHLLGWTIAVRQHGIGALLERGEPDRNRVIFKYIAEEFKKIFKLDNTATLGISDGLKDFAKDWCGNLQKMLKRVKKDYGEYAENYTFNYIYKPRAKKAPAPVDVAAAATAGPKKAGPPSPSPTSVAHAPGMQEGGTAQPKDDTAKAKKSAIGSGAKREAAASSTDEEVPPASKKSKKDQATELINRINAAEGVSDESAIFDSCPVVAAKIKEFLQRDGVTKAMLLKAFGDINSNSLNRFLSGKRQDQCGNVTYQRAYVFFEKLRIMEGKAKSTKRLSNEAENPGGFSTTKARAGGWVIVAR